MAMSRYKLPTQPKLRLVDLLRRRRMTLQDWFKENVVNTYDDLLVWCQLVGIAPPSADEWAEMKPVPAHKLVRAKRDPSSKDV